jgi:hypothetical protein
MLLLIIFWCIIIVKKENYYVTRHSWYYPFSCSTQFTTSKDGKFISSDYLFPAKVYAINNALREGRLLTAMVGAFYLLAELRHHQRTVHQENGTIDKYKEGQTFRVQSNIQASLSILRGKPFQPILKPDTTNTHDTDFIRRVRDYLSPQKTN